LGWRFFRYSGLPCCHGTSRTRGHGNGLIVEAPWKRLVLTASRPSAFPRGCKNGGRPSAAAFSTQRQAFQVGDDFFNLCAFLAEGRQNLVYIHVASGFYEIAWTNFYLYTEVVRSQSIICKLCLHFLKNLPAHFQIIIDNS
jgi:hypothetical protein